MNKFFLQLIFAIKNKYNIKTKITILKLTVNDKLTITTDQGIFSFKQEELYSIDFNLLK